MDINEQGLASDSKSSKDGCTEMFDKEKFSKYLMLVIFVVALLLFLNVIKIFIIDIILAAVFATLFYPIFKFFKNIFNKKGLAAFLTCLLILIGILIPLIVISDVLVKQAVELYQTAGSRVNEIVLKGESGLLGKINNSAAGKWASVHSIDWRSLVNDAVKNTWPIAASIIKKTSRATLGGVIHLFIVLFSIFYFLRDGESIMTKIKFVVPLSEAYKERLIERFSSISKATVKGTLLVALVQATIGTVILFSFGIGSWMLWGLVMLVFSLIPFVGPGAVLIPAGIIRIITGDILSGIIIILLSVGIVSTIDNVLRPRLVGRDTGMHDLLVFFSTLGGIAVFGPVGFIVGPLIAALFLTMLDIYRIEFHHREQEELPL